MANPQDDFTVFVDIPGPSEIIADQADEHEGGAINSASQQLTNNGSVVNSPLAESIQNRPASVGSMAPSQNELLQSSGIENQLYNTYYYIYPVCVHLHRSV